MRDYALWHVHVPLEIDTTSKYKNGNQVAQT